MSPVEFEQLTPEEESKAVVRVRLKIGDTEAELLTDEEVELFVEAWPDNVEMAAADAADAIAAKFARDYTFGEDGQTFNRRERFESYTDLAAKLRSRGGIFVWPTPEPEET